MHTMYDPPYKSVGKCLNTQEPMTSISSHAHERLDERMLQGDEMKEMVCIMIVRSSVY